MSIDTKPLNYARLSFGFLAICHVATIIVLVMIYVDLRQAMELARRASISASLAASNASVVGASASEAADNARAAAC